MANYSYTDSRNVRILRNIVYGEDNDIVIPPESRIEAILQAIFGEVEYDSEVYSRMELILKAIANGETIAGMEPMSRNEKILLTKMAGQTYTDAPQSQIEEILIDWDISSVGAKKVLKWAFGSAEGSLVWADGNGNSGYLIYEESEG